MKLSTVAEPPPPLQAVSGHHLWGEMELSLRRTFLDRTATVGPPEDGESTPGSLEEIAAEMAIFWPNPAESRDATEGKVAPLVETKP